MKWSFPFSLLMVIVLAACYSCTQHDKMEIEKSASAFDLKQGEASVLQSNQRFMKSFGSGDSAGVASCYATDAKLMVSGRPAILGRDEIGHYFAGEMKAGTGDIDLHTLKVWGDSTLLAEEGSYQLSDKKGKKTDKGKYIVLWKQESGNWKMYRDIHTSDLGLSAVPSRQMALPDK